MWQECAVDLALSLFDEYFDKGSKSGYNFLFILVNEEVVGYTCFGHIEGTQSSFDLYWIAIDPKFQNLGLGHKLLKRSEEIALTMGAGRIYIETSSRAKYRPTREFYQHSGYNLESVLKDYYRKRDNKCIYVKRLS